MRVSARSAAGAVVLYLGLASPAAHAQVDAPPQAPAADAEAEPPGSTSGHVVVTEITQEVEPTLRWDPAWGEVGIPEYLMTGVVAVISIVNLGIGPRYDSPSQGGWLFDEDARGVLRLDDEHDRRFARDASDVLLTLMTSYSTLVDAFLVAAWNHHAPAVGLQMALINAEVIAITLALQTTLNVVLSRERPYGRTCGGLGPDDLPADIGDCDGSARYYSFFSGHASQSFAGAAATCSHHLNLPLYGGGVADAVPCIAGFVVAGTAALLRVAGDMHYATDVITGALVGTTVGFLVPWLFHYRFGSGDVNREEDADDGVPAEREGPQITAVPNGLGAAIVGVF